MNDAKGDHGTNTAAVEAFIERWQNTGGRERANYQLFLTELCQLLDLPGPEPAGDDPARNAYVFEHRVDIHHPDGSESRGYIDLYKHDHFVLEAKRVSEKHESSRWDKAMLRAAAQADTYIRALPADEGRPPFLLTCDVGKTIEVYAEFTRSGATYVPFPDPRTHRIHLEDLRRPEVQQRLIGIWTDPDALDPNKRAARVTRELSRTLAGLARALEKDGYEVERVAHFIKRCLFTMFAEDVDLLPKGQFTALLEKLKDTPEHFTNAIQSLWNTMHTGGYSGALNSDILHFNGNLFQDINPIPLKREQIELLIDAARHDWSEVEPAIFGTLLERALDPRERHKLGAHYTPRAYVERLVMPTIIDPLRDEWKTVQAAAVALEAQDKHKKAVGEIQAFHRGLCEIRILDPACGSGNFLYVTLEHMKRLEGEILNTLADMGEGQSLLEMQGNTVDPHQFLGLEINPRAAAIAEMVLWIGYLQWHFRTHGHINPPQPVLKAFKNIECRDAVLDYDRWEYKIDEKTGRPVMRWDGKTYKKSPTTGEDIPDESAQVPVEVYINPRKAEWPEADYVVGNPPFVGEKRLRDSLGSGYVDAVRKAFSNLPACDFVFYWWDIAAHLVIKGKLHRFGFITTNSITQTKNRQIIDRNLGNGLSLSFAIPDHPWVDATDGAAVRIAMTVGQIKEESGALWRSRREEPGDEARKVIFSKQHGKISSRLAIGPNLNSTFGLKANTGLVYQGVKLVGKGFIVKPDKRAEWLSENRHWSEMLPELVSGANLTKGTDPRFCIDFYGLDREQASRAFAPGFQKVLDEVKPHRDASRDSFFREYWWLFGRARGEMRDALSALDRYIATSEVSKHRFFTFLEYPETLPDGSLAVVASSSSLNLGMLSSRLHICWALSQGAMLESRPRWQNQTCFETFPFPEPDEATAIRIADLAEQLDTHRKRQQEQHPGLTMTGMYNVLEKLRREESLTKKEKEIHEQGLISVLRELHDDLDRAVFVAYGWDDLAEKLVGRPGATTPWPEKPEDQSEAEEELLQRLVDLNHQRVAEEAKGRIRWLRPEYQAPDQAAEQAELEAGEQPATEPAAAKTPAKKLTWPKSLQDQIRAVRDQLAATPMAPAALAACYKRKPEKSVTQVLEALHELGMVKPGEDGVYRLREG